MKTVKDVSKITGVSIRTLRYYDEIGLLNPTELTEAGYRLYDNKALEKLQEIMFFRELDIPLIDIKKIMENPNYDKEQALLTQKNLLEQKRNRLNGIIELITDVMKGVNTMSFEAFTNEDVQKIVNHTLESMSKEHIDEQVKNWGSIEKYKEHLSSGFTNEQAVADLLKQLIASLAQAVLHMLLMPFSIITGHNKLAITGGVIRRFFLPPVLFGE